MIASLYQRGSDSRPWAGISVRMPAWAVRRKAPRPWEIFPGRLCSEGRIATTYSQGTDLAAYGAIMRIAQVAPLFESVPPRLYGGTERVVSHLTEELVNQGHQVTLFASADSVTTAELVPVCPRSLWNDPGCHDTLAHHVRLLGMVFADVSRFDII